MKATPTQQQSKKYLLQGITNEKECGCVSSVASTVTAAMEQPVRESRLTRASYPILSRQ